jgi:hypothetical protein
MSGAVPPLPQYAFMAWCLVKAQGQLYIFFTLSKLYCSIYSAVLYLLLNLHCGFILQTAETKGKQ